MLWQLVQVTVSAVSAAIVQVGFLVTMLLEIVLWVRQWKNYENRLIFDKVIGIWKHCAILYIQLYSSERKLTASKQKKIQKNTKIIYLTKKQN